MFFVEILLGVIFCNEKFIEFFLYLLIICERINGYFGVFVWFVI